tara:strand:- start:454 stop:609 length:156 start_codon:yes stop_codon:yes gene_type:complete
MNKLDAKYKKLIKELSDKNIELERLKSNLQEISESNCLGEVAKILRRCGIN